MPLIRYRSLAFFTVATAGLGLVVRSQAAALRKNELAQKASGHSNLYVSVDRSGGGI